MAPRERFDAKFRVTPGCWVWLAAIDSRGYGQSYIGGKPGRGSHRVSYELHVGPIPDGLHVLHRCDNRRCINPEHLFLGTHQDNMRDRNSKGRQAHNRGERGGGSKLSETKVREIKADPRSQRALATMHGVSQGLISLIKRGQRWSHIKEAS